MLHRSVIPHAVFAALIAAVFVYAVTGVEAIREGAEVVAVAMLAVNAVRRKRRRIAWWLLTLSLAAWVAGDLMGGFSPLYLVSYATAHPALVLLLSGESRRRPWRVWLALDGVLAGLVAAAILTGFVRDALVGPGVSVPATTLAGDALLVTTIALAFALNGWRPSGTWWVLGAAEIAIVVTDLAVIGDLGPSRAALTAWMLGLILCCYSAYQRPAAASGEHGGWTAAVVPVGGGALAIALLIHAALTGGRPLTVWLAAAALVVGLVRAILLLGENLELLRRARAEAITDKLTGLPNRRALTEDLDHAFASDRTFTLAFFDLDGFKEYNDTFGHASGDALLQRLAPALSSLSGRGYRLGGDEFCLLVQAELEDDAPLIGRAVDALSENGDGFTITASFGLVVLPREARDADEALRLADERMYTRKRRRRAGQRGQARDVLVQVLAERGAGDSGVAQLTAEVGRRLGLTAEELDVVVRAAELRDVGLVAVPDGILDKPGPLDPAEQAIMRRHPVAGERILAVAESMRPVARVVRSTREHYDGSGYPDALRGEQIPLGARIIAACVAYEAGTLDGAGARFDPRVVAALRELSAVAWTS